ncbi:thermonuclease family protein [Peptoniphilus equinus]|uniref:Thermonuclease family protein n=1 Tax=Peptoniphilus equinus TaxID=3016343 RepID=A0ABY7QUH3_9FIRM|nr:thermonuclease family protein [Peptoniphilus equinus]WBW50437.1 thermonuclease family protein [Peptoniphilus equinus]
MKQLKKAVLVVVIYIVYLGVGSLLDSEATSTTMTSAVVEWVSDGDTLRLTDGSKVRIIGMNAPEINSHEAFSEEAKDFAIETLKDQNVYLEADKETEDQYDRKLYYVWLAPQKEGEVPNMADNFTYLMLERGLARVYTFAPNDKYYDAFISAQDEAIRAKRGMWAVSHEGTTRGNDL